MGVTRLGSFASCVQDRCDEAPDALRDDTRSSNDSVKSDGLESCIWSSYSASLGEVAAGDPAGVVDTEVFFDLFDGRALSAADSISDSSKETSKLRTFLFADDLQSESSCHMNRSVPSV